MMVKAKNGSKKINKKEQRENRTNAVRAKAQAQLAKIAKEKESQMTDTQQMSQKQDMHEVAPFPTENNENFHSESYLSAATKLDEHRVKEKHITTSFHIVRGLLEHDETNSDDDTVIPNKNTSIRVSIKYQ